MRQLANALVRKWLVHQELRQYIEHLEKMVHKHTAKLANSLSLVRATLEATADAVLVIDSNHRIVDYNQNFVEIFQFPPSILNAHDSKLAIKFASFLFLDPKKFIDGVRAANDKPEQSTIDTQTLKDGRIIDLISHPQHLGKKIIGRVWSFRDVTKQKNLEDQLRHKTMHDPLTDVYNQIVFFDRLQQAISIAKDT